MTKDFIEAIAKKNNVGATEIYKEIMIHKIGEALEAKRKEMAKEYLNK